MAGSTHPGTRRTRPAVPDLGCADRRDRSAAALGALVRHRAAPQKYLSRVSDEGPPKWTLTVPPRISGYSRLITILLGERATMYSAGSSSLRLASMCGVLAGMYT